MDFDKTETQDEAFHDMTHRINDKVMEIEGQLGVVIFSWTFLERSERAK
jgi:hypothetical protein